MGKIEVESYIEEGKNKNTIFCSRCPSKILRASIGTYTAKSITLPHLHHKSETDSPDDEEITDFWLVNDMYQFENIGFSKTVNECKYLICADCEMGPIGWHDLQTKCNYLALSRVKND